MFEAHHHNRLEFQPLRAVQSYKVNLILASTLVGEDLNSEVLERFALFRQCAEILQRLVLISQAWLGRKNLFQG
ncbi:hypothetical protein [Acidithiobacillus thiooxidans]|uniref:hypothetical protein n=1 Tax=Acidithiobacillus thiooxidans TaxID=930 RepID=UPI001F518F95|nr:hypothetical protein [Acidithiobacillus thiooxidans]